MYLEGVSHQLRRGLVEGAPDLITPFPPQWTPGPYGFEMAQPIGIRVVADPGETIRQWRVTGARLFSWVFGEYWTLPAGAWRQAGETEWLWFLPDCIDFVSRDGDVLIEKAIEPPPGEGDPADGVVVVSTDSFSKYSDIYVILDDPKPPMTPAWASVLNRSCFWAAGENTSLGANTALTDRLYARGFFNGGFEAYTSGSTNDGETLHLKSLLDAGVNPLRGQCTDFADFLVCLSTSVGASEMKSQRSNPIPEEPNFAVLRTKPLTPAGAFGFSSFYWAHHTFGIVQGSAWDACVDIVEYGVPKDWNRDTTYRNRLVREYREGWSWLPTPVSGFVPAVTTTEPPRQP